MGYLRYKHRLDNGNVIFTSVIGGKEHDYVKCNRIANNRIKRGDYDSLQGFRDKDGDDVIAYGPS